MPRSKKSTTVYGLGVIKKGRSYQPLTAYGHAYRPKPSKQATAAIHKSLTARAKVNVKQGQGGYASRKQYHQALKSANSFSRAGGYKYAGIRQTQYGMAVKYKPTRRSTHRVRRDYKGKFAGSY